MNKISTLKWLLGIVVLMNIGLMAYIFTKAPKGKMDRPGPPRTDAKVQETFGFDKDQMDLFNMSKENHAKGMRDLNKELHTLSNTYYQLDNSENEQKTILADSLQILSKKVYELNDLHFEEIRNICTAEQKPKLHHFIGELLKSNRPPKNRKGPPKDRKK